MVFFRMNISHLTYRRVCSPLVSIFSLCTFLYLSFPRVFFSCISLPRVCFSLVCILLLSTAACIPPPCLFLARMHPYLVFIPLRYIASLSYPSPVCTPLSCVFLSCVYPSPCCSHSPCVFLPCVYPSRVCIPFLCVSLTRVSSFLACIPPRCISSLYSSSVCIPSWCACVYPSPVYPSLV